MTHQTGPQRQARVAPLHRGSDRHRPGDLSRLRHGPQGRAHHDRRLGCRRHGDRGDLGQAARLDHPRHRSIPAVGMQQFQAREIAFGLGVDQRSDRQARADASSAATARSAISTPSMLEINPLVDHQATSNLVALDAKMSFDENALFRRPQIAELRDKSQEDPRETFASDRGLSYVGLDGNIGCIINGAGLAMATMDMIKIAGGEPANFLDIGGGASPERVAKSFRAVLQRQEGQDDPRQHLRRHQPLRLGRRRASSRRSREVEHQDARRRAARRHQRRRGPPHPRRERPDRHHRGNAGRSGRKGRRRRQKAPLTEGDRTHGNSSSTRTPRSSSRASPARSAASTPRK